MHDFVEKCFTMGTRDIKRFYNERTGSMTYIQYVKKNDHKNYHWLLTTLKDFGYVAEKDGDDILFTRTYPLPAVNDVFIWWRNGAWCWSMINEQCRQENRPKLHKIVHMFQSRTRIIYNKWIMKHHGQREINITLSLHSYKSKISHLANIINSLKEYMDSFNNYKDIMPAYESLSDTLINYQHKIKKLESKSLLQN